MKQRLPTREVFVGNVAVGGDNPVRIQSMTTTNTRDIEATAQQIMRLADVGCEIARVTVQGIKEAESCEKIKNALLQKGYTIPLVADIHFYPPAAMRVVDFVDKVRINPGNFADRRATFVIKEYDDTTYASELCKIEELFSPLVEKCKRLKRALRIGTNHGSLSDRIMNRYGDTPRGMVESAFEFARLCRKLDYHDFFFSMKASNPLVMIQTYRLLVKEMQELGWDYPLHLGVTEAGEGEDGRVKSAVGIGSLLLDGIGDTLRVSLTEEPWEEIDPCKRLIAFAEQAGELQMEWNERSIPKKMPLSTLALHRDATVITHLKHLPSSLPEVLGCVDNKRGPLTCDLLWLELSQEELDPSLLNLLHTCQIGLLRGDFMQIKSEEEWPLVKEKRPSLLLFSPKTARIQQSRNLFKKMQEEQIAIPLILCFAYEGAWEDAVIHAAAECGSLLVDGIGDGLCLTGAHDPSLLRSLSFAILQAVRKRTSRTEYISCPGCGRTLFDLQSVTKRIRERTAHLPGVKIAIMGCIVNGPGEMADADFGYVGSKTGKIDLYVGKQCVERNIDFSEADARLIALIKEHGRWQDPV